MGKPLKCLISILLLAGLVGIFFWPLLCGKEVFYFGDFLGFFYPLRHYAAERIRSLEIPLWNPHILCGTPFLATWHSACFYPLSIIYYLLPFSIGFHIFIVVHIFLGALFMYLLARNWLKNDLCALVAAAAFAFSGYLISVTDYVNTLSSIVWIPLVLVLFEKALETRRWRYAVWAGIAFAVQVLAGGPEPVGLALLLLVAYTIRRRAAPRALFYLALLLVIAFSISAVQLVPFAELFLNTERWVEEISSHWSAGPLTLARCIFPHFLARPGKWGLAWDEQLWLKSSYLGMATLLLALFAFFTVHERRTYLYGFAGLFFLLLSLGDWTPLWSLAFRFVPGFAAVRYPVKFLGGLTLCLSVLAGAGAKSLLAHLRLKRFLRLSSLLLASLGVLLILVFTAGYFFRGLLPSHLTGLSLGQTTNGGFGQVDEITEAYLSTIQSFGRTGFFLILVAGVLLYAMRPKAKNFFVAGALLAIILADLLSFAGGTFKTPLLTPGRGLIFTASSEIYKKIPATAQYIQRQDGLYRTYREDPLRRYLETFPINEPQDIIAPKMEALVYDVGMLYGVSLVGGFEALLIEDFEIIHRPAEWMSPAAGEKWLDFVGAKFIIKPPRETATWARRALPEVAKNKGAFARAFLVQRSEVLPQDEILERILEGRWEPGEMVFVEEVLPRSEEAERGAVESVSRPGGEVKIIRWVPEEEIMDVSAPEPAFLVISQTFYPGWKAEIDGKPTRIYRANYAFRALVIPAGNHRVRIYYSPLSFKIGIAISILGLGLTILLLLWPRKGNHSLRTTHDEQPETKREL